MCGNGTYFGGVEIPSDIEKAATYKNEILIFDALLQPKCISHASAMAFHSVLGKDGDTQLISFSCTASVGSSPYLVIYDLSKSDFPAMLNLTFNSHLTERGSDIIVEGEPWPEPPHLTRFSRWSFVHHSDTHLQDVVIEEKKDGKYIEVARFEFNENERKWIGPPGSDDEVWKTGNTEDCHLKFEELKAKDFPFYQKYEPKIKVDEIDE